MVLILVYFSLFIFVHITSKLFVSRNVRRMYQIVMCFTLLFIFFGFRNITVLNDTPHYYGAYYHVSQYMSYLHSSIFSYDIALKFEWGYQVLMHFLVKYVSKEPYTIIMLSSLVFACGNIWFISKFTDEIALASFIMIISGVWFDQFCLIRQTIALMFFYKAYLYLKENKTLFYCILVLLGSLFHLSALTLLIIPAIKKLKINAKNVTIVFSIAIVIAIFIYKLLGLLGFAGHVYLKVSMQREAPPIAAVLDGILMLIIILTCYYIHKQLSNKELDKTDFWICIFALCVSIMTPAFLPIFRINVYTWPIIYIIFFKYIINNDNTIILTDKAIALRNIILILFIAIMLIRIIIILLFKSEWNHIIPYSFYDFSDDYHYYNLYLQKDH